MRGPLQRLSRRAALSLRPHSFEDDTGPRPSAHPTGRNVFFLNPHWGDVATEASEKMAFKSNVALVVMRGAGVNCNSHWCLEPSDSEWVRRLFFSLAASARSLFQASCFGHAPSAPLSGQRLQYG